MASVSVVIKIGGGLLAQAGCLDSVLEQIAIIGRDESVLVVPGGGPFADAVRDVDRRVGLSDDAAHWMAILAMDQYAHLIASRLRNGSLITASREISPALEDGRIPVLAPYHWIREDDPLPHSWDVTSDSISAWIAGQVGAARLVLIKPAGAFGQLVDPCFGRFLPSFVAAEMVNADRIDQLRSASRRV